MRKTRFTEEQIAHALRQAEAGTPVREVIRKLGVSEQTFYRWKRKFEGMGVAELRRLRQLEEENRKLKGLVADLSLDKRILQDVIEKMYGPPALSSGTHAMGYRLRQCIRPRCGAIPNAPGHDGICAYPSSKTASV
jgi:putative transposase